MEQITSSICIDNELNNRQIKTVKQDDNKKNAPLQLLSAKGGV